MGRGRRELSSVRKKQAAERVYRALVDTAEYSDVSVPSLPSVGERKRVLVLRGIPASGKSTWVELVMRAYPQGSVARLNNDDVLGLMFGSSYGEEMEGVHHLLGEVRVGMLRAALANEMVRLVIVDNTNLASRTVARLEAVSVVLGAEFVVDDRFLFVPVEECLRRNSLRDRQVPDDVIRRMGRQAERLRPWKSRMVRLRQYDNSDESLPEVTLVDLDGVLARLGPRGPFEWGRVECDEPNPAMVALVRGLLSEGRQVIVFSARDGAALEGSRRWVERNVASGLQVFHKGVGDNRSASVVKPEMALRLLEGRYRIGCVVDDDADVVAAFRTMGLRVWWVNDGER